MSAETSVTTDTTDTRGILDSFTRGYIRCALWSTLDEDGQGALEDSYTPEDIAPGTLSLIDRDCAAFVEKAGPMIAERPYIAGVDFWLTRNGHGAGFWCGTDPDEWGDNADKLTEIAHTFPEVDWVAEDGAVVQYPA